MPEEPATGEVDGQREVSRLQVQISTAVNATVCQQTGDLMGASVTRFVLAQHDMLRGRSPIREACASSACRP